MLARVQSYLLQGIDALPCEVEVDFYENVTAAESRGTIVGLPDAAVKESMERVRVALANSGYFLPIGRWLVNLAPADVRKEGPLYDLPIALGLLMTQGVIRPAAAAIAAGRPRPGSEDRAGLDYRRFLFAGELALDGRLRPIKGAIAMAALAKAKGLDGVVVPFDNAAEAAVVEGIEVLGVRTLVEVIGLISGDLEPAPHPAPDVSGLLRAAHASVDFVDVRGQEAVKRAIVVAAAGGHNLLRLWPSDGHCGSWVRTCLGSASHLIEEH